MSSKINVLCIVSAHFKTLRNFGSSKISKSDVFTFIVLPFLLAICGAFFYFNLNKDLDSLLVNFGAIFTALLLSVIVLIYDQENRNLEKIHQHNDQVGVVTKRRLALLKELYHNISYAILCSLLLVVLAFIHSIVPMTEEKNAYSLVFKGIDFRFSIATTLITPMIVLITSNIILTIIMVVKRLYLILISNN